MTDRIARAALEVDYDFYATEPDGSSVAQRSSPEVIQRMLRLADVGPGHRVLEIGTGSGYSSALIEDVVGAGGAVCSVDVDPYLTARARVKHQARGSLIRIHTGDGLDGYTPGAPYDRIIGWATPHLILSAWMTQAAPRAVIVTPVKVAAIAGANAIVKVDVMDGAPTRPSLHAGSFIEMHGKRIEQLNVPVRYVDARVGGGKDMMWLSSPSLRGAGIAQESFERLTQDEQRVTRGPFGVPPPEPFWLWLCAVQPDGLAAVGFGRDRGFGFASDQSAALLINDSLVTFGEPAAADVVHGWASKWAEAGKPTVEALEPRLEEVADGWRVSALSRQRAYGSGIREARKDDQSPAGALAPWLVHDSKRRVSRG